MNTKYYTITAVADQVPAKGCIYNGVKFYFIRNKPIDLGVPVEQLMVVDESGVPDAYTMSFLTHELYTEAEVHQLHRDLMAFDENFVGVEIRAFNLPAEGNYIPSDVLGCGGTEGAFEFNNFPDWNGLDVYGYFSVRDISPESRFTRYTFSPDGSCDSLSLEAGAMKEFVAAYNKAISEGVEAGYTKITKLTDDLCDTPF